jgi:2-succinyl-5-enolpyruvyl-6-hydroxy-3-cyclohexene-1-carboxylate synthase
VILGNSLPVRMAAWLAPTLPNPLRLYFTRGANGIDGSIAAAVGLAKGGERPAVAILGDVTAAHDISSLALAETLRTPLVLLVVDNAGGRIFEHLPANEDFRANPNLLKSLLTPPALNWAALAEGFGVRFACASSKMELESALKTALAHSGTTLLHCPVLPTTTQFCADLREKE